MLERFRILKKEKEAGIALKSPKHIAITTNGTTSWAIKHEVTFEEAFKKSFAIINNAMEVQINQKIPIITFYLMAEETKKKPEIFTQVVSAVTVLFEGLVGNKLIHENKIKISILGKWYDLPSRLVDAIKGALDETRDYDSFFVNFCINYDGNEEIVDACKLVARQISADKLSPEAINAELIKENLYSSYFLPPDIIIKNGKERTTAGLLLWDSAHSHVHFSEKNWPDFDKDNLMKAIKDYQSKN
ncbi:di-trans,poly-cis-decaprenylcistransferase [Candidatus Woesearchaeota archaeon]|nr:di-trans,poly-cis-decaprenylcistransferase [Candidatus Woesearchaeota archaeon]